MICSSFVGPEQHVALVPVLDAQHLRAVIAVAPALLPDLRRLDRGHQKLDGARPVLLLANDLLDLFQNAKAQRQPRINPGARLADHARPEHEPVGDDFRLFGIVAQNREEIAAESHLSAPRRRLPWRPKPRDIDLSKAACNAGADVITDLKRIFDT